MDTIQKQFYPFHTALRVMAWQKKRKDVSNVFLDETHLNNCARGVQCPHCPH